jgi:hypothetical protein
LATRLKTLARSICSTLNVGVFFSSSKLA